MRTSAKNDQLAHFYYFWNCLRCISNSCSQFKQTVRWWCSMALTTTMLPGRFTIRLAFHSGCKNHGVVEQECRRAQLWGFSPQQKEQWHDMCSSLQTGWGCPWRSFVISDVQHCTVHPRDKKNLYEYIISNFPKIRHGFQVTSTFVLFILWTLLVFSANARGSQGRKWTLGSVNVGYSLLDNLWSDGNLHQVA